MCIKEDLKQACLCSATNDLKQVTVTPKNESIIFPSHSKRHIHVAI